MARSRTKSETRYEDEQRSYSKMIGEYFRNEVDPQPGDVVTSRFSTDTGVILARLEPQGVLLGFDIRWGTGQTTKSYLAVLKPQLEKAGA